MAAQHKARLGQPGLPAFLGPDRRRVVEQTVFFLLLGQPGELGVERTIGRQKRLLAVEDRRIGAGEKSKQSISRVRSESLTLRLSVGCRSVSNSG
jgi:hypothetical protein